MPDTSNQSTGAGTLLAILVGIPVVFYGGWWLFFRAPRLLDARMAERRSPPRYY